MVSAPGQQGLYLDGRLILESDNMSTKNVLEALMEQQIDLVEYEYDDEEISSEALEEFDWTLPTKLLNLTPYFL